MIPLNIQLFSTSGASKTITKTIKDSYNNAYTVTITLGETLGDDYVETNKSLISGKVVVSNTGNGGAYTSSKDMSATMVFKKTNSSGDTLLTKSGSCAFNFDGSATKTATPLNFSNAEIIHNSDGSLTLYIEITLKITSTSLKQTQTYTDTLALTTIPRASVLNSFSISIANNETTKITPNFSVYSNSFYHSLVVTAGSQTFTLKGVSSGTAVTLTEEQRNKIFAAIGTETSTSISAYLVTGTDSTNWNSVGNSATKSATATLPSYTLSITATLSDLNNNYTPPGGSHPISYFKSNAAQMLLNLSSPRIAYTITSSTGYLYGRTISTSGSVTKSGLSSGSSFNLDLASNNFGSSYSLTATDGRKTATKTTAITVISYSVPSASALLTRPLSTGSEVDYKVTWKYAAVSGLTNLQTATATLKWKLHTASSYSNTKSITVSGSTSSSSTGVLGTNFNYKQALDYQIVLVDKIGYTITVPGYLSSGLPAFNTYKDSNGNNFMAVNGTLKLMASDGSYIPIEVEVVDTW